MPKFNLTKILAAIDSAMAIVRVLRGQRLDTKPTVKDRIPAGSRSSVRKYGKKDR